MEVFLLRIQCRISWTRSAPMPPSDRIERRRRALPRCPEKSCGSGTQSRREWKYFSCEYNAVYRGRGPRLCHRQIGSNDDVERCLDALKKAAAQEPRAGANGSISPANTMPYIVDAVRAYATVRSDRTTTSSVASMP